MAKMKPIREFVAKDDATGERRYRYHTAVGTLEVHGKTGQWLVFRTSVLLADVELLDDVERIVNAYVAATS